MDEDMIQSAQTGDINLLYELILNDPYVLQRIDDVPFFNTQLHVAASAGHIEFMVEMVKLKPTFARKLNQAGFSPMHLALQNDRTQAVVRLLRFDEGLVRVKGTEDLTPLHHVVQTGNVDPLIKLLAVCPEAIEDVTVRDETVFHLAVKNAFLVGGLQSCHESADRWEEELLSWVDIGVVEVLLEHFKAGGLSGSSSSLPNISTSLFHIQSLKKIRHGRGKKGMPHGMRHTFLVVTVLIITTTYNASLNPPKTPDDSAFKNYQFSLSQDQPLNSHTFLHKTDINTAPVPNEWTSEYSSFWVYNTLTFWAAVFLTAILLPPHSFSWLINTYRVWEILHEFSCCFVVVMGTIC
ncbi:hypothetical protein GOBAR_AA12235 [Gossypium barbadense]|uniref:Uncharacterized protein n=1 Tax=Gossypium barbadense TaxID=3634 RepID=A0A2P5XYI5_GOSBA|nr:hypothetical protein GOBAR_AA12235 [Gossypium barbadense]